MWSPYVRLQRKRTGGQAAVEDDSLKLEVENQAIVQELLNVERNLNAVNSAVVRKADFDGNVETSVIVGMNVESYGGRQKRGGIEEEIHLRKVGHRWCARRRLHGGRLGDGQVLDRLSVSRFKADIGCYIARR